MVALGSAKDGGVYIFYTLYEGLLAGGPVLIGRNILKRPLQAISLLLVVVTVTFSLMQLAPEHPAIGG